MRARALVLIGLVACNRTPAPTPSAAAAPAPLEGGRGKQQAEQLAKNLETMAKRTPDPALAGQLHEGAADAREIGAHLEAFDRAEQLTREMEPTFAIITRLLDLQRDRHRSSESYSEEKLLAHEAAVRERLARLDRELAERPDEKNELEDAALDDLMALIGK